MTGRPAAGRCPPPAPGVRPPGAAVSHAAVYPAVPAGSYTIWRDDGTPAATVTITGGTVTNCHWPG